MENRVIARLRQDREWTQSQAAERVCDAVEAVTGTRPGVDGNWISRLERGQVTWPNDDYRRALRTVYGMTTDAQLGLYSKRTRCDRTRKEVGASQRRTFLSLPLTGIFAETPARLSKGDLNALSERTLALQEWDRRTGGVHTRHLAMAELQRAIDLTGSSTTPAVRAGLCAGIGNLGDLAGWTHFDAGSEKQARRVFALALKAAVEGGDEAMVCHVASGLARVELAAHQPQATLALLEMAEEKVPTSALSMLAVPRAQAHALNGDERQVMKNISLAETIYSRVTDLRDDPPQFWYLTEHKLHGDIGDALFMLSQTTGRVPAELVARLRRAVDSQTSNRARAKDIAPPGDWPRCCTGRRPGTKRTTMRTPRLACLGS
ncbi:helix-turn-helix domain-containing protein [Streptomyces sp. NPDC052396]|uniref:helix-turn-helix domain-containing protein n=1 Tax=Streptomyces sp. NPDC052396 TaxID=3365689 RepID=UPI0037CFBEE7